MIRHLNRGGTEDFGAMLFVLLIPFYLLGLVIYILKLAIGFNLTIGSPETKFLINVISLIILWVSIYFGDKYFISDRQRRNLFFEDFDKLPERQKTVWKIVALFFMFIPVWLLIAILVVRL